jgi:iron(III) transport system ATP-binding protein
MTDLAINNVGLRVGTNSILKGISLVALAGQTTALLGAPGSGKTALLRIIAGLDYPQCGSIRIGDKIVCDVTKKIDLAARERGIGLTFQSLALPPQWTAFESIAVYAHFKIADQAAAKARVNGLLAEMGLSQIASRRIEQLSRSEQLRVALARAMLADPQVLLLDDPLAGLDTAAHGDSRLFLRQFIARTGVTVLLTARNIADAFALSDRVALLNAGVVEQEGTATDLYTAPTTAFAATYMGVNNCFEGKIVEKEGTRAFVEIAGWRLGGVSRTHAQVGDMATAMIRGELILLGGGPGANRIPMRIVAQMYLGARWEIVFVKDTLIVRAYTSAPLRHEDYHVEFPVEALWIY